MTTGYVVEENDEFAHVLTGDHLNIFIEITKITFILRVTRDKIRGRRRFCKPQ